MRFKGLGSLALGGALCSFLVASAVAQQKTTERSKPQKAAEPTEPPILLNRGIWSLWVTTTFKVGAPFGLM